MDTFYLNETDELLFGSLTFNSDWTLKLVTPAGVNILVLSAVAYVHLDRTNEEQSLVYMFSNQALTSQVVKNLPPHLSELVLFSPAVPFIKGTHTQQFQIIAADDWKEMLREESSEVKSGRVESRGEHDDVITNSSSQSTHEDEYESLDQATNSEQDLAESITDEEAYEEF